MNQPDAPSVSEGTPEKPVKKRPPRKKKATTSTPATTPSMNGEADSRGRLGSDLTEKVGRYFVKPWFPYSILSLVVGHANVGKSTLLAWLVAQAKNTIVLPGFEEEVEMMTLSRMRHNGVNLKRVRFLDDRVYTLPRDKQRIANIIRGWEADLLIIDPIDSYLDEGMKENDGQNVRLMLEAAFWIAKETEAAVVAVRHPGKDKKNLLVGSRSWRNVPKSIIELYSDEQKPPRYYLRHEKDSAGNDWPTVEYVLEGEPGKPRLFKIKGSVDDALGQFASSASDPTSRIKVRLAGQMLRFMWDNETEVFAEDHMARCRAQGIGEGAVYEARKQLGIFAVPSGSGAKWILKRLAKEWPKWTEIDKH